MKVVSASSSGQAQDGHVRTASEKSTKNESKIDEDPCQIDQKLTENRSWAVLGTQSRFGDASGRARDDYWTRKCCPKARLGTPRASQKRPRTVQKRHRAGPETLRRLSGTISEHFCSIGHHRTARCQREPLAGQRSRRVFVQCWGDRKKPEA